MTAPRRFSLNDGGPFYRLLARLHLIRPCGEARSWWLALFAWLPIVLGETIRVAAGRRVEPTMLDISAHVRLLFSLPMILHSERLVEGACRSAIRSLYAGKFTDASAIDRIVERGERLRDLWWPEAALLVLALIGGQLVLWRIVGEVGVFHGGTVGSAWSFPRLWYVVIALPLAQFVMFRWLWRWVIWSYMLACISHLQLDALATHPDRAAGLACLARPISGFSGFALAIGAVLAGAWGTQIIAHRTTFEAQLPTLLGFLLVMLAIAVAPLLLFCGHLYRERRRALAQYGDFAGEYTREFHDKWIERRTAAPLGTPDIQSLNDIGGAYSVISNTRIFVFGMRTVLAVWSCAAMPMVPLLASVVTVEHILQRIANVVVRGLPL
jgi:hypothetical protein